MPTPKGLEVSRLASRGLVSHIWSRPGWPGRLHRVVRRRWGSFVACDIGGRDESSQERHYAYHNA